jgi:hypothetical protein
MAISRASKQAKQRRGLLSQGILVTSGYISGLVALRLARFTVVHLFPPFDHRVLGSNYFKYC